MNEILKIENMNYSVYSGKNLKQILKGINFSINQNDILGISGESGSGKTTLAKVIAGILLPTDGKVNFMGTQEPDGSSRANPVQILFQNSGEILNPLRGINEVIKEAITIADKENDPQIKMEEIFNVLDFPNHLWNRKGYELSGGEQQRAALARILAVNPQLLILDEPFSAQDPESQLNLLDLFLSLNKKFNITIICIAHNLKILGRLCNKMVILYEGEIMEQGNAAEILKTPKHPYTKYLLKAENYNLSSEELKYNKESFNNV
ncbi:MAG: ATP-binding cassette domain-containing protein [Ignavibacteriaceae bacterium]